MRVRDYSERCPYARQMYHFEPRTTPRALLQRPSDAAAAQGLSKASGGEIIVKVPRLPLWFPGTAFKTARSHCR